jgi:glycosyltransferase
MIILRGVHMDDFFRRPNYNDRLSSYRQDVESILVRDSDVNLRPIVSIMIPTYRRPDLLRESVASALAQTTAIPFEVVVIDNDGEQTMVEQVDEVLSSFDALNLKVFRNTDNIGLYENWNRCIELACGSWLTILNDDDLLDQTFIDEAYKVASFDESISLVGCEAKVLYELQDHIAPVTFNKKLKFYLKRLFGMLDKRKAYRLSVENYFLSYPHHGSLGILMKREVAQELGGYFPKIYPISDYDFLVRFVLSNNVYFLPKELATYRIAVNVSIKTDFCSDGIHNELLLRKAMIPHLNINATISRYYADLAAVRSVSVFRKSWHSNLDVEKILSREGLVYRPIFVEYLIMKGLLRVILAWKRFRHM